MAAGGEPQDLSAVAWPLRTPRLLIRPARADDVAATYAYRRLPEVHHWITYAGEDPDDYAARWVPPGRLTRTLVVELAGTDHGSAGSGGSDSSDGRGTTVVGDLMVSVDDAWGQSEVAERAAGTVAELGWAFDPAHTGRGLATEAVGELVRACFEDLGLRRVVASCFAANTASWRLMERLGMRREVATVRDSLHRSGEWLDGVGYALLAEEWRARRA
ncbi:GNAT family protein [Nocardioides perillae]|uniref:RimJ/RimL family protein N-acetyltransferase n=1 Tax=Nocardioides perillae TaxID=1119534 RepID=A0A7Y9RPD7_9ACTN|nr:RimJ/RimL family protein N-acetyltransferase [Nocardioides perillae]